jgi:hypothetical protein
MKAADRQPRRTKCPVRRLTGAIEVQTADVEAPAGDIGGLTANIGTLTGNVGALTFDIGALTFNVEALTFDIGALTLDVFELKKSGNNLICNGLHQNCKKWSKIARFGLCRAAAVAEYCLRDVRATVELYKIWKERLAGIK